MSSIDLLESDQSKQYNVEELIDKAGKFGRFQWLVVMYVMITISGVNFYSTNLAYLELVPDLKWRYVVGEEFRNWRDVKDVCGSEVYDWYPNFKDRESFHNWMTEQNLYCKSSFMIGLFGSLFFVGLAVNGL